MNNNKGFTIIELAIAMAVMTVILAALVATLRVGDMASGIGTEKVNIQSDVRTLIDWMSKDIRQAIGWELCLPAHPPTTDYIKFNKWLWNNTSCELEVTDKYVEYEYDSGTQTLTRRYIEDDVIVYEHNFTNITMSPFYTSYTDETTNEFNTSDALCVDPRTLIIVIKKEKTVRTTPLSFTMIEEVKIRND